MAAHFIRGKYRDEQIIIAPSLDAIEKAYDVLLAVPERDSADWFGVRDTKAAADTGNLQLMAWHLFWDAYNWLKFFWYSSAYKARQLTAALIHSYNTDNLLSWAILGRSSLEYAAITHYFAKKVAEADLKGPNFALSQLKLLEDAMLNYANGSRFNWTDLLVGNIDNLRLKFEPTGASKAINVMTALDHLSRRDNRYEDVKAAYDMLSDFAHPNMASHCAVTEMPSQLGDKHKASLAACPGPLRGEFMMVTTLPWISTGVGTTVEVSSELVPILQRWLDYADQGKRLNIHLEA
jgi:hypothetical protein